MISDCNAFKLGTESTGGFQNIAVSNCAIRDTRLSGIALESVDGGILEGVVISNIVMRNVRSAIFVRLGDRARPYQEGLARPGVGSARNISLMSIDAAGLDELGEIERADGEAEVRERGGTPVAILEDLADKIVTERYPVDRTVVIQEDPATRFYQLTHDYLVTALRNGSGNQPAFGKDLSDDDAYAMAAWSGARDRRRQAATEPEASAVSDTIPAVPRARSRVPRTRTPR